MNGSNWVSAVPSVRIFYVVLHRCAGTHTRYNISVHAHGYIYIRVALFSVKAYLEVFEGILRKAVVNYKEYPQTTHLTIALWLAASLCFHVALWPHYGWNTIVVLFCLFFGWMLQPMLLLPPWLQNVVAFVGLTFFLQEYQ